MTSAGNPGDFPDALRQEALQVLEGPGRERFLSNLVYWAAMACRDSYPEAHASEPPPASETVASLRAWNEIQIVIGTQLAVALGIQRDGYPHEAFLDVIVGTSKTGGIGRMLEWAVERAVSESTS